MSISTEQIRNIVISGHGATGKTTLTEHMLFLGGAIPKPEKVEGGKTVSDFTEEEIAKQISIHTSLSHITWNKKKVNILDTPGSSDFVGEVVASLRAAESAVLLVSADSGVQIETIKVLRRLSKTSFPRFVFVNKMDKEHADFNKTLDDIKEKFKGTIVPVTIPIGKGNDFKGVIDLVNQKAYLNTDPNSAVPVPADMADTVEEYRMSLIEAAAEGNDELMEKYLETESLSNEEIGKGLAQGLKNCKLVPVLCGAAILNAGVVSLLDFIDSTAPCPQGEIPATSLNGKTECTREISTGGDSAAFVFKTSIDQFSGKLSFIKVISGKITSDSELICSSNEKKEKLSKIYTSLGKKLLDCSELLAGDIGILVKLSSAETNDTLFSGEGLKFLSLDLPQPVHAVAISAINKKDEDKMNQMLHKFSSEDLTFKVQYNTETKENVISCMGEQHLGIMLDKIKENQKIELETHVPRVAYRETITTSASSEYQHKKQSGGHGQYAKVMLSLKPIPRGEYFKFVNAVFGGAISKGYMPGIEKGVLEGMEHGVLAGYPVVDIEATVNDGKEHPVDSSEMSFKIAGRGALRAAMEKAKPVLLEPVMNLTVFVEDQYLGDVLSDLSSRRGRVLGQEPVGGGIQEIKAQVPQAELLRYSIDLRSITSGTASFEIEFDHYNPISGKVADDVIKAAEAAKEA